MRPDPDAAFFEDWSQWEDLGGGTPPLWHCRLHHNIAALERQPGFALRVPQDAHIRDALMRCGATKGRPSRYRSARSTAYDMEAEHWFYVPAARYMSLRAALPGIRAIIMRRTQDHGR